MLNPDERISEEQKAYRTLKRFFHSPDISNEVARKIYNGYVKKYPDGEYLSSLKRKYLWHRQLRGYRYRKVTTEIVGTELLDKRVNEFRRQGADIKSVLLVSHEMSLTGAPRALLNMAKVLKDNGFNPYILSLRSGLLCKEAEEYEIPVIVDLERLLGIWYLKETEDTVLTDFLKSFPTVLLNTMESITMFPLSLIPDARKIGWIHESAQSYSNMSREYFDDLISKYDELFIVGDYARGNALTLTPKAKDFKNLFYGVDSIDMDTLEDGDGKFTDSRLHLLIAGTIEKRKGHHILADALFRLSPEERNKIVIHCAGSIKDEDVARHLHKKAGDSVKFEGTLAHDHLISLLRKCDALICPSLDDPMPIVCTEAFQLGKPVLVSDTTGTASFIKEGKNGFIVHGGDVDDLVRGIRGLIRQRDSLPEIGSEGVKIYVDNFSKESFTSSVLSIFNPKRHV